MDSGTKPVPQSLRAPSRKIEVLARGHNLDSALLSKDPHHNTTRDSLAALYALAARLHSARLPFHAKHIETSAQKKVSTEQIWGQLSILQRPVLRRLEENVGKAVQLYGDKRKEKPSLRKASNKSKREEEVVRESESDPEDLDHLLNGDPSAPSSSRGPTKAERISDLDESDLDEEIDTLLKEKAKRQKGATTGGDDWRYAFGKSNEEDESWDDFEEDRADRNEEDFDEEEMEGEERGKIRDRNARAMMDAEDEEDEEGDAEEELAALKEMYGEDFDPDEAELGDDEDPDLEEDIELDDPNYEGDLFDEKEGKFWGRDDMLNDTEGKFEENDPSFDYEGVEETRGEEGEDAFMTEELAEALKDPSLTPLERERLKEKAWVQYLEEKRLYDTNWSMTGETAANKRPKEALLDVNDLEFEHGMRAVPVVTEAFTMKLEDRIKKRILNKDFDDVTKRVAMTTPSDLTAKKYDAALDAQQSKLSLMDLYEKDFLEKQRRAEGDDGTTAEPLTEIEKDELRAVQMWKRLSQHLDALSNYNFTPKPIQEDLEARVRAVDKQAPAITMEAVGNFATTRAQALAPQDLYRGSSRKFADVGSAELQPSERRALRKAKKEEGKRHKDSKASLKRKREAVKETE